MEKSKWKFRRVISYILATVMVISTFAYGGIPKAAVVEAEEYSSGEVYSTTLAVGDIIRSGVTVKAYYDEFGIYYGDSEEPTQYSSWTADKDYKVIERLSYSGDIRIQENASKQDQTITASDVTMTYGDSAKAIGATTSGDGTLSYSVTSGADVISVDSSGNISITKAGSASIKITASETNTYKAAEKTISVTVNKANPTITASDQTMTYGDSSKAIGATTNGGTLSYEVTSGTDVISVNNSGSISIIKAGSAQVKITAAENDNYLSGDKTISVTVNKANPVIGTAPAAIENLVYNGTAQELVSAGTISDEAIATASTENKLQYRISSYNGSTRRGTTSWGDSIPVGTNAGSYQVQYRIVDNETDETVNFNPNRNSNSNRNTEIGTISVTISKLEVIVTPDAGYKVYGKKDPGFTYTVAAKNEGQVIPEADLSNGMLKQGTMSREIGENVGEYAFTLGNLNSGNNNTNYSIELATATEQNSVATFEITRKSLKDEDILLVAVGSSDKTEENGFEYAYKGESIVAQFAIYYTGREVDANGNNISRAFNANNPTSRNNNAYKLTDDTDYVFSGETTAKQPNVDEEIDPFDINFRGEGNYQDNISDKWAVIRSTFNVSETAYDGTYDGKEHEALEVHPSPSSNYTKEAKTYEYILLGKEEMSAEGFDKNSVLNNPEEAWNTYASLKTTAVPMIKDVLLDEDGDAQSYVVLYKITMNGYEDYISAVEPMIWKIDVDLEANDADSKVYDNNPETDPELTFEDFSDQLLEEDVEAISAAVKISREEGQDAGKYEIGFNIDELNETFTNYNFTETTGTFEITKRNAKVSFGEYAWTYSDEPEDIAPIYEIAGAEGVAEDEGVVAGDEEALNLSLRFNKGSTTVRSLSRTMDVGEYEITLSRRTSNTNYNIVIDEPGKLTISPKDISDEDIHVVFNGKTDELYYACDFTGSKITPKVAIQHFVGEDGKINCMKYGKEQASGGSSTPDYRFTGVEYATEIGLYYINVEGLNNYTGSIEIAWAILPIDIFTKTTYNGQEQSPEYLDDFDPANYDNLFTIEYSLDGENYQKEMPTFVDVNINDDGQVAPYIIYYLITFDKAEYGTDEDGNPLKFELVTIFTILPAPLEIRYPYAEKEYDGDTAIRFENLEAYGVTDDDEFVVSIDAALDEADSNTALDMDEDEYRPVTITEKQIEEAIIEVVEGSDAKLSNYELTIEKDAENYAKDFGAIVNPKVLYNIDDDKCDGTAYISAKATDRMYDGTADIDATIEVVTGVEGEEITFSDVITDNEKVVVELDDDGKPVATDIAVTGIVEAAEGTKLANYIYYVDGKGYNLSDTTFWSEDNQDLWTGEVETTVTISPAVITFTGKDITKTYDGKEVKASDVEVTVTGFEGIEDEVTKYYNENADKVIVVTLDKTAKNAGTYNTTTVLADEEMFNLLQGNANYLVQGTDAVITINKKAVTATVKDATKVAGQADPTFKYSVDGLVAGESLKNAKVSRKVGETAGTYELTLSCDADPNYTFTFVKGKLTITAAPKPTPAPTENYSGEWVKGQWYGADGNKNYKPQGSWKQNATGWWYEDTSGWYPVSQWQKIDGLWYYFDANGYMASSEWIDGYWLDSDGAWRYAARGSWSQDENGWWYGDTSGWYAGHGWQKIDGKYYFFDESGYVVTEQYVGNDWVGSDGAWVAE